MTYLYACENRHRFESQEHGLMVCPEPGCGRGLYRRYRDEGVGLGSGVKVSRDGTARDMGELFLPDNSEFAGPDDPDGTKGLREWHDTHQPKEGAGDRSLVPGRIDKRSF